MKIGIIGAGVAGIASAKALKQFGHDVTVYEKSPDIGGVWSSTRRYPHLTTQNDKSTYQFSQLAFPKSCPEWPASEDVQRYLEDYATRFDVFQHFRTSTEIRSADLINGESAWDLHWQHTDGSTGVDRVDHVVVANGIFCEPRIPDFAGAEEFTESGGSIVAPQHIRHTSDAANKHVLVVGYNKSACDIATVLADASASTTVVARSLGWKMPQRVCGTLNYKYLLLTRFGESLFPYHTPGSAERMLHEGPGTIVRDSLLNAVGAAYCHQFKLPKLGLVPPGSFGDIADGSACLTTDGFFERIHTGIIDVAHNTTIRQLTVTDGRREAHLSTGHVMPADLIICATGFHQTVPFFSADIRKRLTDDDGNYELYRSVLPHDVPALTFCGYNSSFFSPLSAEMAALWTASYLAGLHQVPGTETRRAEVARRLDWMEQRTGGNHAKGTSRLPFSLHNIDDLTSDMGVDIHPTAKARQWLLPVDPAAYQTVVRDLLHRHRSGTAAPSRCVRPEGPVPAERRMVNA